MINEIKKYFKELNFIRFVMLGLIWIFILIYIIIVKHSTIATLFLSIIVPFVIDFLFGINRYGLLEIGPTINRDDIEYKRINGYYYPLLYDKWYIKKGEKELTANFKDAINFDNFQEYVIYKTCR